MIRAYRGVVPKIAASCLHRSQRSSDRRRGDRRTFERVVQRHDPGDVNYIRIGEETSIQDNSVIHVEHSDPDATGFPTDHRQPRHRWPFGHAARLHRSRTSA